MLTSGDRHLCRALNAISGLRLFLLLLILPASTLHGAPTPAGGDQRSNGEAVLASLASRNRPAYIDELGIRGVNYELDREGKPFIWCEGFDSSLGAPSRRVACYANGKFERLGCMAVLVHGPLTNEDSSPANATIASSRGCWTQSDEIMNRECSDHGCMMEFHRDSPKPAFCCCRTNMCNSNITYEAVAPPAATVVAPRQSLHPDPDGGAGALPDSKNGSDPSAVSSPADTSLLWDLVCAGLIIFLVVCVVVAVALLYCLLRTRLHGKIKFNDAVKRITPPLLRREDEEPELATFQFKGSKATAKDVVVLGKLAEGRFGDVYKARLGQEAPLLAAKSFRTYDSWLNEREIYLLDAVRVHPNIAEFVAAYHYDKQFWLITTFYANGSLHDYLQGHTLSVADAGRISSSMISGLAFLHEEIPADDGQGGAAELKPPIAHRDFKSKNVLVKDDLTACIADFGLALKCDDRRISESETHGQIGTRRYMAPELLEGATDFTSFAFQQIDVYAAALVLWEILSRTCVVDNADDAEEEILPDLELPYEAETGANSSLGRIREVVVTHKQRPVIPPRLLTNEYTALVVKTMTEMWDAEPDGRITSGCARDRLLRIHAAISGNESGQQHRMQTDGDTAS